MNSLNIFYTSVNADIPPLDCSVLPAFLPAPDTTPIIEPVATIFDTSLTSGTIPAAWKDSCISPIPKVSQPTCEGDTRPISLTACLSKVLEDFVVRWMMKDVVNNLDIQQFGCLKLSSTAYCLLDMIHNWLFHLDYPDKHIHLLFLDYTKAFDRIGHNVLISKLIDIGVRALLSHGL